LKEKSSSFFSRRPLSKVMLSKETSPGNFLRVIGSSPSLYSTTSAAAGDDFYFSLEEAFSSSRLSFCICAE